MSLRPDDRSSRSRSKSRTRDRSRSRSHVRTESATTTKTKTAAVEPRYAYPTPTTAAMRDAAIVMPAVPGGYEDVARYEIRSSGVLKGQGNYEHASTTTSTSGAGLPYPETGLFGMEGPLSPTAENITMGDWTDFPPHERPGYLPPSQQGEARNAYDPHLAYGASPPELLRQQSETSSSGGGAQRPYLATSSSSGGPIPQFRYATSPPGAATAALPSYSQQQEYKYAALPEKVTYTDKPQTSAFPPVSYTQPPSSTQYSQVRHSAPSQTAGAQIVEVTPGMSRAKPATLGLGPRMERLSVSGNRHDIQGGLPPPSPLLEAYHGTYQSISPMPSPMMLPDDRDIDDLPPLSPLTNSKRTSKSGRPRTTSSAQDRLAKDAAAAKASSSSISTSIPASTLTSTQRKRVQLYDSEGEAKALADALSHRTPNTDVIIDILPPLSHDQILELRTEYKRFAKVQGRGINIAKHLKLKLSSGNFGKAAYVVALGRWESEGYWANFWYQSHGARRELLIESLMGRTNAEVGLIKDAFRDKRYSDDLARCMEKELKADKFRQAVLMVLQERRQEEGEVYPAEYRERDVQILERCLRAREGGETAMLEIVVRRSDAHLREVLRMFESRYGVNFAREALKKSGNLVGELIAHILNGIINKPARDALLLRHAINDIATRNKDDEIRYELLISRLVRIHWDRMHLARVKREYEVKYGRQIEEDIEDATKGDFREFMCELCRVNVG